MIELSGVGAGTGESIFLAEGTSFRLTQLFQESAGRVGSSTTTRGRGPHYGIPQYLGFGGRSALSAYVHWDGADDTAHTLEDTIAAIDPEKLDQVGQTTLLTVLTRAGLLVHRPALKHRSKSDGAQSRATIHLRATAT